MSDLNMYLALWIKKAQFSTALLLWFPQVTVCPSHVLQCCDATQPEGLGLRR